VVPSATLTIQPITATTTEVETGPIPTPTPKDGLPSPSPELTASPTTMPPTATTRPPLGKDEWKELPIIPEMSDHIIEIYQRGLELGNRPNAFSKVGDCGSTPAWFLGDFDRGDSFYDLGEHQNLEAVIQNYLDSFGRTSLAARSGFNASSLFVTLWADRTQCESIESPLDCEYRVHQPSIALINLGTNDVWHPAEFEPQLRKIIEYSIERGVIPVLATKADNAEGDHSINAVIAKLAYEYEVPLWNYWLAVQPLTSQGLQDDGSHLTWGRNFFNDPIAMDKAWPVRNLNALQILDAIWIKLQGQINQ